MTIFRASLPALQKCTCAGFKAEVAGFVRGLLNIGTPVAPHASLCLELFARKLKASEPLKTA